MNQLKQNLPNIRAFVLAVAIGLMATACNREKDSQMDAFINDLMDRMTLEEKLGQLNLNNLESGIVTGARMNTDVKEKIKQGRLGAVLNISGYDTVRMAQQLAVDSSRLGIPLFFGMDVIHGHKTIWPIPLALSCTWDPGLIEKSARLAATEASADGLNWVYSPMVDIVRDPRWGRVAEGAGEDPYLGSLVAAAMVKGYQGKDVKDDDAVMACVKHFALYGAAEAGRDYNTVDMSRIRMFQEYLPPYRAAVEAGAGSIMTSFNDINGIPATANRWLLTSLLREEWGFDGFVVTDYTAINEMVNHGLGDLQAVSVLALKAGVDMDMVGEGFLTTLEKSLEEGKVKIEEIDRACRKVLEAKFRMGLFDDPYRHLDRERASRELATPDKLSFAREIARRSMVLLKNKEHTLPLKKEGTLAVIGPLADRPGDMLGTWVVSPDRSKIVTILQGIREAAGDRMKIIHATGAHVTDDPFLYEALHRDNPSAWPGLSAGKPSGKEQLNEALRAASSADVIVAVLGETAAMSGEAASRADIGIPGAQRELLASLVETGKPVVLVLVNGRPLTLAWEDTYVDAILETWASGSEAGHAVADVLFGDYNPSGKLTMTFPRSVGQIPIYYNHKNTGRPLNPAEKYTSRYLDIPNEPLYPFGYGLSYTTFAYGDPEPNRTVLEGNDTLLLTIPVTNTGPVAGEEVVQLYIRDPVASISRPVNELKGFRKIMLQAGEMQQVTFKVSAADLCFYNSDLEYTWEPGEFILSVGPHSANLKSVTINWNE